MKPYLLIFSIFFLFISCEELELVPSDRLSDATVWDKTETADLFLNDIYNSLNAGPYPSVWTNLPSEISNDPLDNYTDNSTYGPEAGIPSAQLFNNGSYGPSNPLFSNQWRNMYANIRKCNLFIEKITETGFDDATKNGMIAQARFLRAYFYRQLIDLHGGVPLITKVLRNDTGEEIFFARDSYDDCVAFVQKECSEIIDHLPLTLSQENLGRATKGAALALKGEEELYAGKWADAVETHQKIIDLGIYDLFPDYVGLFYADNENNEEVIFDIQFAPELKYKNINQYWGVPMVAKGAGWGACDPTQNLVDNYEFKDGKTEAEGSELFEPENPYKNRDNRFYASIIYDGSVWRGTVIYTRLGIPNNDNEINIVGKTGNAGRTGYFMKKLQDSTIYSTSSRLDGANVIIYRYAEVLLNYAEAKNELSGPDPAVYSAINKIRARAGQPNLPEGLSKDQMRERIRKERRIELAFEGKYFYDIIRWKTAEEIFSKPIYGMKITEENGKLVYEKVAVRNISFDSRKHYLQPIPQYALDQNQKLEPTPGY